jgi:hypothetical protein
MLWTRTKYLWVRNQIFLGLELILKKEGKGTSVFSPVGQIARCWPGEPCRGGPAGRPHVGRSRGLGQGCQGRIIGSSLGGRRRRVLGGAAPGGREDVENGVRGHRMWR